MGIESRILLDANGRRELSVAVFTDILEFHTINETYSRALLVQLYSNTKLVIIITRIALERRTR